MAPPSTPTGFGVTITGQRADLSWTAPGTQTYYEIERRVGAGSYSAIYYPLSFVSKHYDTTVYPSTSYGYRIRACNADGCSSFTSEQTGSTGAASTATGSLSVPATAVVGETVLIDARASTNFSKRPQADGSPSVDLDFGDGYSTKLLASGHMYMAPGTYTVRLNGKNASGVSATEVTADIVVSAFPAATGPNTQTLTDGGVSAVANGTALQNAVNTAAANNTSNEQKIVLSGSWTLGIQGPINLTVPAGNKWIHIIWSGMSLPITSRAFPSDFTNAPTILNSTSGNTGCFDTGATNPSPATHHYKIEGVRLTRDVYVPGANSGSGFAQGLMHIGHTNQPTVSCIPHHIIVDHCWFDGRTEADAYSKDGLNVLGDNITVMNSYFAEFKRPTGADPTGMSVSGGRGPVGVWNNEFIADGENYSENNSNPHLRFTATVSSPTTTSCTLSNTTNLNVDDNISFVVNGFDGAAFSTIVRTINVGTGAITFDAIDHPPDNSSTAEWECINSFLEYRRNYAWKPLKWRASDPSYIGTLMNLKNLWETKSGRYHVLHGNVFRYNWYVYQPYTIVIGSASHEAGKANTIREFDMTNNLLRDTMSGVDITGGMPSGGRVGCQANSDFHYYNNLHLNVGIMWDPTVNNQQFTWAGGMWWSGTGQVVGAPYRRAFVTHNTFDNGDVNNSSTSGFTGFNEICGIRTGTGCIDSQFFNNAMQDQGYGFNTQCGVGGQDVAIATYFPPGAPLTHTKNLIVNPNGHTYPASDLTTTGWTDEFVDYTNGNFTLANGTTGKTAATDGSDIGVNMTELQVALGMSSQNVKTATISVVTGIWEADSNLSPTVNAGDDQVLSIGTTSTTLTGTANDPESDPLDYAWTRVSGPNTPTIVSPTALSTSVTGMIDGSYVFRLTVDDGVNTPVSDDVSVSIGVEPLEIVQLCRWDTSPRCVDIV